MSGNEPISSPSRCRLFRYLFRERPRREWVLFFRCLNDTNGLLLCLRGSSKRQGAKLGLALLETREIISMPSHWERKTVSAPVYHHVHRSKGLVQRLRTGERMQDAATEHWYVKPGTRSPVIRPNGEEVKASPSPPRRKSGSLSPPRNAPENGTGAGAATKAALVATPKRLKEQLRLEKEAQELRRARFKAAVHIGVVNEKADERFLHSMRPEARSADGPAGATFTQLLNAAVAHSNLQKAAVGGTAVRLEAAFQKKVEQKVQRLSRTLEAHGARTANAPATTADGALTQVLAVMPGAAAPTGDSAVRPASRTRAASASRVAAHLE